MKKVLCWNALCHLTAGCIIASTRTYYIFMCLLSMTVTVSRMTFLLVCFVMIHAGLQQLYCFPSFNEMWTDTTRCKIRWKFKDKMFFCEAFWFEEKEILFPLGTELCVWRIRLKIVLFECVWSIGWEEQVWLLLTQLNVFPVDSMSDCKWGKYVRVYRGATSHM